MSKKCPIIINTPKLISKLMSAKRHLHLLLVASLIVFLFALLPASAEEKNLEIINLEHQYSKNDNNIQIKTNNYDNEIVNCNLILTVFSQDLMDTLPLDNSITFFNIQPNNSENHNFTFRIPRSGDYTFNATLLVEKNDIVNKYYISEEFTFYDYLEYDLEDTIADYYYDIEENANWIYNQDKEQIELINIEGEYDTGIVLGPFNTEGLIYSNLNIKYEHLRSNTAEFTISITNNFNRSAIYATQWDIIHYVSDETKINFETPKTSELFILIRSQDNLLNEDNYWSINQIYLEKLSLKHSLHINHEKHYFFNIDTTPTLNINVKNNGVFDQQLGNISTIFTLISKDKIIRTYLETPSIESEDEQNITIRLNEDLEPGNYYINVETTIIDREHYYEHSLIFISVSNKDLGKHSVHISELQNKTIKSENNEIQLLLKSSQIDNLRIDKENTIRELIDEYYIIELTTNYQEFTLSTDTEFDAEILSIISMDQVKYNISDKETQIDSVEGITAPSIVFDDGEEKIIRLWIKNEGFYEEKYTLNYIYASTFVESVEGEKAIDIMPNQERFIEVKIKPLANTPRDGGSQFNIEISNNNENKLLTYVLSYLETEIEITEIMCDRYAVIIEQNLKCTTVLTNKGYKTNNLNFALYAQENLIEEVEIEKLDYLETWTLTTIYTPESEDYISISGKVITSEGKTFEKINQLNIRIVNPEKVDEEKVTNINLPNMNFSRGIIILSLAGLLYQIQRSENLKYLGLKFFFVPLYSRLQKDTLADEPTRQKLLKYIYSEPGANFKQLKDKLSLHNGTLAHHINILESHDVITSYRSGRQRLFFPIGINQNISRNTLITNDTQKNILNIVKNKPGITQSMISKKLNMSRQKINYHVNTLVDKAFLNIEKEGRITRLYPLYYT